MFVMKLDKKHKERIIADYLKEKQEILFAYIFGSFVQKDNYHDIDIAVYLKDDFDKNDFSLYPYGYESGFISELNKLTRENIDFIVINDAPLTFQKKVIEQGEPLFCKNERIRIRFENYTRKLYIDLQYLQKIRRYYLSGKILNA